MRRPPVSSTPRPAAVPTRDGRRMTGEEMADFIDGRRPRIERGETSAKFKKAVAGVGALAVVGLGLYTLWPSSSQQTVPQQSLLTPEQQTADAAFFDASNPAKFAERTRAVTEATSFFDRHLAKTIDGKDSATMAELQNLAHALGKDDAYKAFTDALDDMYQTPAYGLGDQHALRNMPLPRQKDAGYDALKAARDCRDAMMAGNPVAFSAELNKRPNALKMMQGLQAAEQDLDIGSSKRSGFLPLEKYFPTARATTFNAVAAPVSAAKPAGAVTPNDGKPHVENFPTTTVPAKPGVQESRLVSVGGTVFQVPADAGTAQAGLPQTGTAPATQPATVSPFSDQRTLNVLQALAQKTDSALMDSGRESYAAALHDTYDHIGDELRKLHQVAPHEQDAFIKSAGAWTKKLLTDMERTPEGRNAMAKLSAKDQALIKALKQSIGMSVSGTVKPPAGYAPTR